MSKTKVLITTDIGGGDADDAQSLIHALLYADQVDYRGVVATVSDAGRADPFVHMRRIADAYEKDLPNLRAHGDYPSADGIRSLFEMGSHDPDWPGKLSAGAERIIAEARAADPSDPLYVLSWGPIQDVARALHAAPDIVPNIRVLSIAGHAQDSRNPEAFRWMRDAVANEDAYHDLWWVDSVDTFRGMYIGSDGQNDPNLNVGWVEKNAAGHGALGELFHKEYAQGLYGPKSKVDGLKMGDTPSLLYLLDGASDDNPGARSWGGSFQKDGLGPNTWSDRGGERMGSFEGARTVYEHRDEAWGDFARRLDRAKDSADARPDPRPEPGPDPAPGPAEASIGTGRTEVEDLDLSGYRFERREASSSGANVRTEDDGTASGVFEGAAGTYRVTVGYLNEHDGASDWSLAVDGRTVKSWSGTTGRRDGEETVSVELALAPGDEISLRGSSDRGELARLDWMQIEPTGGAPRAEPKPDPKSEPKPEPKPDRDAAEPDADLFVFAGQSNAAGHFYRRSGGDSSGPLGSDVFERALEGWTGEDVRVVNAAVSGSGSNQYADRAKYWWDVDADRPGPELQRAVKLMRDAEASGRDIDGLIWAQGEDDARVVSDDRSNLDITMRRLDEATRATFDYIRKALGDDDLPIFIQELGDFRQDGGWLDGPTGALDSMRAVQANIVRGMADVYLGARTQDVNAHADTIHFSNAGYARIADRLADKVIDVFADDLL